SGSASYARSPRAARSSSGPSPSAWSCRPPTTGRENSFGGHPQVPVLIGLSMRIDVHAHYFPPEYLALLSRLAGGAAETEHRVPAGRLPLDERADLLTEVGIDRQ